MDPVAALEEIAFLLERDRASRYKSTAFRRAAAIIEEYTPEELAARVHDGRLKRTKGSPGGVIRVYRGGGVTAPPTSGRATSPGGTEGAGWMTSTTPGARSSRSMARAR